MNKSPVSTLDRTSVERQNKPDAHLHRYRLRMGRIVWVVIAAFSFSLFFLSLMPYAALLHTICTSATSVCSMDGALSPAGFQALHHLGISLNAYIWYTIVFTMLDALVWTIVGLLIFWHRSGDWMALIVALFMVTFNLGLTGGPVSALVQWSPAWKIPIACLDFLQTVLVVLFLYLFPSGRFVPRWMRWMLVPYVVQEIALIFLPQNSSLNSQNWPAWLNGLFDLAVVGTVIFSQIYRYRRVSTAPERQQIKWVVYGIVMALVGFLALTLLSLFLPTLSLQSGLFDVGNDSLYFIVLLPIPLSLGVAMLRYRLYDIDILINRTLVYGTLSVSLALVYTGLVIGSQALLRGLINQTNDIAIVASTLVVAALFQPLRHRIQAIIDRRFYRRKYDAAKTLEAFSATLRSEVDLSQLREHLLNVVQETMQPAHVSLWLRSPQRHTEEPLHRVEKPGTMSEGF